ncbi:hypothetical protein Tco_1074037 [Tanacetum coccineum]
MKRGFKGNQVPLLPAMLAPAQGEGSAILAGSQPTPPEPDIPQSQDPTPTLVADEATTTSVEVDAEGAATTTASLDAGLDSGNIHESPLRSHDAPLPEVNTSGSAEDSVKLQELMELVPNFVLRIDSLEKELTKITQIFGNEVLTLKNRVKTLEVALKRKSKKNQGTWKLSQLKKLTFEEIKEKFDKLVKQIDTFVPMGLEATKARMKRYSEELKQVAAKDVPVTEEKARETTVPKEEEVEKSTKIKRRRLKTKARKGLNVDKDAQEALETDKEEDMEAIGAIHVTTKSPTMLKDITRDDLTELYRLVMQKYGANRHEDVYDRVLWSDLRTIFESPLSKDVIWKRKYPLSSDACQAMLDMKLQGGK